MADAAPFHVHCQNLPDDPQFAVTERVWAEACARNGADPAAFRLTISDTREGFLAAIGTAQGVIAPTTQVKNNFPAEAPALRIVQCTSAGLDRLAPYDWLPAGAHLCNNSGVHAGKAGEFGIMAILMLANNIPAFATFQRAERWQKIFTHVLAGRTAVIVGLGDIGGAIAGHARRFGMRVIGVRARPEPHPECDRVVTDAEIETVLPAADMLVLAMPLTARTRGMFTRERLSLLKPGAGLVNIARGSVIDQEALCDMLDEGRLGGAVLDVFTPEPVPAGHRLWRTRNLVMVPHCSSDDPDTYTPMTLDIFFRNLAALRAGKRLPTEIDIVQGY